MGNKADLPLGVPWVLEFDPDTGAFWPHVKLDGSLASGTVYLGASEAHIGEVGGRLRPSQVTFAKETGTAAYAQYDAVSNSASAPTVLTFSSLARVNGGSGYITKARLMTDQPTCTAQFRLHLYNVPPTAKPDNGQFDLGWNNDEIRLGCIDFGALATEGTGSTAASAILTPGSGNLPFAFNCSGSTTAIYGLLETLTAFTPNSAQSFFIKLVADVY